METTVDCRCLSAWWINRLQKERKGMVSCNAFPVTAMAVAAPLPLTRVEILYKDPYSPPSSSSFLNFNNTKHKQKQHSSKTRLPTYVFRLARLPSCLQLSLLRSYQNPVPNTKWSLVSLTTNPNQQPS